MSLSPTSKGGLRVSARGFEKGLEVRPVLPGEEDEVCEQGTKKGSPWEGRQGLSSHRPGL